MPIRWSTRQVAESLDEMERVLTEAEPILQRLADKAQQAANVANLPEYMRQPLGWLKLKTLDFYSGQKQRIDKMREYIPKEALAKEQAEFDKVLAFYNGDRRKAEMTMTLSHPKLEVPREQASFFTPVPSDEQGLDDLQSDIYPTEDVDVSAVMVTEDYIYCEDCQMFVDLWKYDSLEDTGHSEHNWRYVTEQELAQCIEDCRRGGCFDEQFL